MEGKEVRFGRRPVRAVRCRDDRARPRRGQCHARSFTPIGGLVPLFLIQLGEVLPGGVGSGLYGILILC